MKDESDTTAATATVNARTDYTSNTTYLWKTIQAVKKLYSDEPDGRCAIGVIMEYYGWDGKHNSDMTKSLLATYHALKKANISDDIIIELNDSGVTFDEIADFLDRYQNWLASKHNVPGGICLL